MLVSHDKGFIFTKTAKTGGTSVEVAFQPYCVPPGRDVNGGEALVTEHGIVGARGENAQASTWWNHMPASQIKRQIGDEIWNEYVKFSIVRNPYDKVVSWFHFRNPRARRMDQTKMLEMFNCWIADEQTQLPIDRDKYLLRYQKALDRLLRYENLEAEVRELAQLLNCDIGRLPRLKAHHRQDVELPYEAYYGSKARKRVEQEFAFELEAFDYTC